MNYSTLFLTEDDIYLNLHKSVPELILRPPNTDVTVKFPLTPEALSKLSHLLDVALGENEKNPYLY